ncbi:MAG: RHS repeat protein, partial [Burkholderiales bacterium]|nr:RHS repeat protein [Burkholderiales bacterium]
MIKLTLASPLLGYSRLAHPQELGDNKEGDTSCAAPADNDCDGDDCDNDDDDDDDDDTEGDPPAPDDGGDGNDGSSATGTPGGTDGNGSENNTGGGAGGGCVEVCSYLPDGQQAGQICVGDSMQLGDAVSLAAARGIVSFSKRKRAQGLRITTASGVTLVCSDSAPIPTLAGLMLAPKLLGQTVAVRRDQDGQSLQGWELVTELVWLGEIEVQHITVGDRCFWAGEAPNAYILHHNLKQEPGSGGGNREDEFIDTWDLMGDPIDLRLADKRHIQVDYAARGAAALRMARVYHSNAAVNSARVTVPMGAGWHMLYDRSLQVLSGSQIRLHRANGSTLDFSGSGSNWASDLPAGALSAISGGWQYVNNRNIVEVYDSNGRLLSLTHHGRVTSMQYEGGGRLARVVNPFGRTLNFSYDAAGRVSNLTLPDGNSLGYAYDSRGNATSIKFADGSQRSYVYENTGFPNALTGIVDESGRRRLTWGYDAQGRPNLAYYGQGTNTVNATYNGNQVVTTDARGITRTRNYGYIGNRRVLTSLASSASADSAATNWQFSYDGRGNRYSVTSRTGELRNFSVDARGRTQAVTRAVGTAQATSLQTTWHSTWRTPVQTTGHGITRNFTLDTAGRVTAITQGAVILRSRSYNAQNLLASVTDARGATISYTYDALGNRTSRRDAQGQTTTYSNFNAHGQAQRIVTPDNIVISRSFDARGRLATRSVGSLTTSYSRDAAGRILRTNLPDGSARTFAYDSAGLLSSRGNHLGEQLSLSRDGAGAVTKRSLLDAGGTARRTAYNQYTSMGRLSALVNSKGQATKLNYGADGRLSNIVNPLSIARSYQYDPLDRVISTSQPFAMSSTMMKSASFSTQLAAVMAEDTSDYGGSSGEPASSTDAIGVATGYGYDGYNRRVSENGNDAGVKNFPRNAAGDVNTITDARGITLSISRDGLGRITAITPPSGTALRYSYVAGSTDARLATMSDASGATSWAYDSNGGLTSKTQTLGTVSKTLSISRDSLGRATLVTYPSGTTLAFSYSGDKVASLAVNGVSLLSNISYAPLSGSATGWRWGNGASYQRGIDQDGRVASVTLGNATRSYQYDAAGQLTGHSDAGARAAAYGYDAAGRVVAYTGVAGNQTYSYDANGNRLSSSFAGATASYTITAGTNRIAAGNGYSYSYFADGAIAADSSLRYVYDNYGSLSQAISNGDFKANYVSNGLGQRVQRSNYTWVEGTGGGTLPLAAPRTPAPLSNAAKRRTRLA